MWGSAWTAVLLSACLALSLADDNRAEDNEEESNEEWYDDFVPEASRTSCKLSFLVLLAGGQDQLAQPDYCCRLPYAHV